MKAIELKIEIIKFFKAFNEDPDDLKILINLLEAFAEQYCKEEEEE